MNPSTNSNSSKLPLIDNNGCIDQMIEKKYYS